MNPWLIVIPDRVKTFVLAAGWALVLYPLLTTFQGMGAARGEPPSGGPLINVSGLCTRPDGAPAMEATVHAFARSFQTSVGVKHAPNSRPDDAGQFTLEGVPAGQTLRLYAETRDRLVAGTAEVQASPGADPGFRVVVRLVPTVTVEKVLSDDRGRPLASRKVRVTPRVGKESLTSLTRTVETDFQGRIEVEGIIPGLVYRLQEEGPTSDGSPRLDEVLVFAPAAGK